MEKQCVWCNKPYVDVTKRKVGKTCSKQCASSWMVQKRKNNGSYARTQQQNERLSKTLLNKSKTEGFWVSPEAQKLGQEKSKLSNSIIDESTGERFSLTKKKLTCLEKYGVEFPQTTDVVKQKIIQTNIEKYGSQFPTKSKQVKEKTKKTRLEKGLTKLYEGMTMREWSEKLGVSYSYFKQVVNEQSFESAKFLSKEQTIIEKTISELLNKYNNTWIKDNAMTIPIDPLTAVLRKGVRFKLVKNFLSLQAKKAKTKKIAEKLALRSHAITNVDAAINKHSPNQGA
jgi:hypothetical protein